MEALINSLRTLKKRLEEYFRTIGLILESINNESEEIILEDFLSEFSNIEIDFVEKESGALIELTIDGVEGGKQKFDFLSMKEAIKFLLLFLDKTLTEERNFREDTKNILTNLYREELPEIVEDLSGVRVSLSQSISMLNYIVDSTKVVKTLDN